MADLNVGGAAGGSYIAPGSEIIRRTKAGGLLGPGESSQSSQSVGEQSEETKRADRNYVDNPEIPLGYTQDKTASERTLYIWQDKDKDGNIDLNEKGALKIYVRVGGQWLEIKNKDGEALNDANFRLTDRDMQANAPEVAGDNQIDKNERELRESIIIELAGYYALSYEDMAEGLAAADSFFMASRQAIRETTGEIKSAIKDCVGLETKAARTKLEALNKYHSNVIDVVIKNWEKIKDSQEKIAAKILSCFAAKKTGLYDLFKINPQDLKDMLPYSIEEFTKENILKYLSVGKIGRGTETGAADKTSSDSKDDVTQIDKDIRALSSSLGGITTSAEAKEVLRKLGEHEERAKKTDKYASYFKEVIDEKRMQIAQLFCRNSHSEVKLEGLNLWGEIYKNNKSDDAIKGNYASAAYEIVNDQMEAAQSGHSINSSDELLKVAVDTLLLLQKETEGTSLGVKIAEVLKYIDESLLAKASKELKTEEKTDKKKEPVTSITGLDYEKIAEYLDALGYASPSYLREDLPADESQATDILVSLFDKFNKTYQEYTDPNFKSKPKEDKQKKAGELLKQAIVLWHYAKLYSEKKMNIQTFTVALHTKFPEAQAMIAQINKSGLTISISARMDAAISYVFNGTKEMQDRMIEVYGDKKKL
ncbi:hypothetical protein A2246_04655 [candidate division WOR-1 bacterium RIFOXYA2_FULL_37_7]|nr:MAG: hypothetical protein A2246_04655 [candidate division WOR-1 bacterium RIFOXYA2_FULL_37_7]